MCSTTVEPETSAVPFCGPWTARDLRGHPTGQSRDIEMTFHNQPQPVLKPQLEHV